MKMRFKIWLVMLVVLGVSLSASANVLINKGSIPNDEKPGVVQKMTKADFIEKVMDYEKNPTEWKYKGDKPCVIDFYADWCGPCRITSPILEELAEEYKGKIIIYKVDVDHERELSQVFGVKGIPAFLYVPMEGKPSMTSGIARDKEQTKAMFKNYIDTLLLKKELQ